MLYLLTTVYRDGHVLSRCAGFAANESNDEDEAESAGLFCPGALGFAADESDDEGEPESAGLADAAQGVAASPTPMPRRRPTLPPGRCTWRTRLRCTLRCSSSFLHISPAQAWISASTTAHVNGDPKGLLMRRLTYRLLRFLAGLVSTT